MTHPHRIRPKCTRCFSEIISKCVFLKRGNLNPYNNFVYFYLSNYNKAIVNGNL